METKHHLLFKNANQLRELETESVDLVVTSPPYPMISMWDEVFGMQNPDIQTSLNNRDGSRAFGQMHEILDMVWLEMYRVLKEGGFACINIGDATRKLNGDFCLYPNHARILNCLSSLGFNILPDILWRKQTNAPNKFMGSGMLPAGAYVTLEHEYILIVRKGSKRSFNTLQEKRNRHESALFWEERNVWFSDIWLDVKGTDQKFADKPSRLRSAAFPFEIAYRLVNMYSVKGDTVLDPFLGTGTTALAAIATGRNSIGVEIDASFEHTVHHLISEAISFANKNQSVRLNRHEAFVEKRIQEKKPLKYENKHHGFPVMTRQEEQILLNPLMETAEQDQNVFKVQYSDVPNSNPRQVDHYDNLPENESRNYTLAL